MKQVLEFSEQAIHDKKNWINVEKGDSYGFLAEMLVYDGDWWIAVGKYHSNNGEKDGEIWIYLQEEIPNPTYAEEVLESEWLYIVLA